MTAVEYDGDETGERPSEANPNFVGSAGDLANLAIRTMMWTILTFGIYRFWMKTHLRRYYWSSIRADGEPFEYTGKGSELFLGFLLALVFLTIYLLVVNFALIFGGFVFLGESAIAVLSTLAILPLIPFAQYRARRYLLSRTRWRGIRFGVGAGSFGYALRWMLFGFLTVATLGLLAPVGRFQLAKFAANRTWYGDMRLSQGGSWLGLFAAWLPTWLVVGPIAFGFAALFGLGLAADENGDLPTEIEGPLQDFALTYAPMIERAAPAAPFVLLAALILYVWYSVFAFRYLTRHKYFGDRAVRFRSDLSASAIIGIYIVGVILTILVVLGVVLAIAAITAGGFLATGATVDAAGFESAEGTMFALAQYFESSPIGVPLLVVAGIFSYLILILVLAACAEVFFTRRVLSRICRTLTVYGVEQARIAAQRPHDSAVEGQGFADALDVGGGI